MWGRKKNQPPTIQEQAEIQRASQIIASEMGVPFAEIPFDQKVLVDEKVLNYFEPENVNYHECYEPLKPFCSPALATGQLTEQELRRLKRKLNRAKAEAYCLAKERKHYFIINSLVDHIWAYLLGSARQGFKLKQLTENRKTLRMINSPEKKRGWWPF